MKKEPNQSLQTISCSVTVAAEPLCVPPHEMSDLKRSAKMKLPPPLPSVKRNRKAPHAAHALSGVATGIIAYAFLFDFTEGEAFSTTAFGLIFVLPIGICFAVAINSTLQKFSFSYRPAISHASTAVVVMLSYLILANSGI